MARWSTETQGWFWGFWGMVGFSLTLPATQAAVPWLGPTVVGLGRALVAALVAVVLLTVRREPFPRSQLAGLLVVVVGVILGFPWLSAWAMARVPATHGAVMLALLPLATAGAAAWRAHERPSWKFWAASGAGSAIVIAYALMQGAGRLVPADGVLLGAVALAAVGYAEGGRLARTLGGWRVICWALVLSIPVTIGPVIAAAIHVRWGTVPPVAWLGFAYVAGISQLLAFFAWYHGLALGGVARISQIQYFQVFLTLAWSAWWLHEPVIGATGITALLVVVVVAWGKSAAIRPAPQQVGSGSATS